jgi:hypothetical protein
MSLTAHLVGLVVAAIVITTILVVGTLLAADIIHLGRREESPARKPEEPGSDGPSVEALAPLGSSVAAGARLGGPR